MNGSLKDRIVSHDLYKIIEAYVEENPKSAVAIGALIVFVLAFSVFGPMVIHALGSYFDTSQAQI
jgi:hypothetical protein